MSSDSVSAFAPMVVENQEKIKMELNDEEKANLEGESGILDLDTIEVGSNGSSQVEDVEQNLNQRQGFSSEQFKIEIQNLPKFFGIGQMKKLLVKKLQVKPHKLKPLGPKASYMFMNFANEIDREDAIAKLDGYELKGRKLKAFKIRAAKDPMIKAREKKEEEEIIGK